MANLAISANVPTITALAFAAWIDIQILSRKRVPSFAVRLLGIERWNRHAVLNCIAAHGDDAQVSRVDAFTISADSV